MSSVNWQSMELRSTAWVGFLNLQKFPAKFNQNIDELLETVLLVAEIQELKADPTVRAIGTVIEARLDKGKKVRSQPSLFNKVPWNVQDPPLSEIPWTCPCHDQ